MSENKIDRRNFFKYAGRGLCAAGLVAVGLKSVSGKDGFVWQIDPYKCTSCGLCSTSCVLEESAVKCIHSYKICGYCDLCTGFFEPDPKALDTGAENQLCPTGALIRNYIEDPYFEYKVDEPTCIGCAKCVKGCNAFGNGSLYLQVRHDRCLNCNECAISVVCPANAFEKIEASKGYLLKKE